MSDLDDEVSSVLMQMDKTRKEFEHLGSANPMRQRNGAEARYGLLYQRLVRIGARPQLKRKYRGR